MSKFAFAWRCYADLQQHALQSHRIGDCSWGLEQGLDYLIAAISSDTVPVNPQILEANLKGSVEQQILFKTGLGYSDAEIAHEFASTPNAIRIRLLRLRRKLAA
jgi:hypothetical protein